MQLETAYKILGVSNQSSLQDIKNSFRKKAKIFHPDVNKSSNAETIFKELNSAYNLVIKLHSKFKRQESRQTKPNLNTTGLKVVNLYSMTKPHLENTGYYVYSFHLDKENFDNGCFVKIWTLSNPNVPLGSLTVNPGSSYKMEYSAFKNGMKILIRLENFVDT